MTQPPNQITGAKAAGACGFMRLVLWRFPSCRRRSPPLRSVPSLDQQVRLKTYECFPAQGQLSAVRLLGRSTGRSPRVALPADHLRDEVDFVTWAFPFARHAVFLVPRILPKRAVDAQTSFWRGDGIVRFESDGLLAIAFEQMKGRRSNQSVEPTGGSRFARGVFVIQRRLPPVAHAWR